jgi:quercetin dioxygenase-like cupin family protein
LRSRPLSPSDWPLWGARATLDAGATLQWDTEHGDEAIYVLEGALEMDGKRCPAQGSVIVEAGVPATVTAAEPTTIVHFGPRDTAPPAGGRNGPAAPGERVHMIGPGGVWASRDDVRDTRMYADSTCPTCRATIFYTSRAEPYVSAGHSHSQDELIHMLWGEINVGKRKLTAGDTIAIPADLRYGFRSGPDGFGFLNYRPDASVQSFERGGEPRIEGGKANGMNEVNDVIN